MSSHLCKHAVQNSICSTAATPRFVKRFSSSRISHPARGRTRCYATQPPRAEPSDQVPPWPRATSPTPYEILDTKRGAPYTKRRFYQLVKLYHPDTHDRPASSFPAIQQLSNATRLERYRLIVAANDLLSDPQKRRLYDHHGIGWTDDLRPHDVRGADRAWRHRPGNASRNATWEDWERWRNERDGNNNNNKSSELMYMSNGMFATLVVCMCMIGALAQMNRAEAVGEQYVDLVQQKDWAIGQKMRESTVAASGRSKDERVDSFLRERENLSFEFQPAKFDGAPSSHPNRSG
ncbi:hypothetical protein C2857_001438 [Epichloe festucae Fl1]|uniref:J domain-containing protein n=1 Tax=Epichloe festucae (strain Fl1) TaxID=877507 RepID=A0A7S9KJS9_EPIFF|nr:hypothetical protein C2857_001438 [Epichloe festucae Fl1]